MKLTKPQACRYLLKHQRLNPPGSVQGKEGILDYIHTVGCIQFDPLDMVGCNPHLVLQSRVKGYKPAMLGELLYQDRKLVDGFDKNLAIYPVEDWPCFERYRSGARDWHGRDDGPFYAMLDVVRREITQRGPLSSSDLEAGEKVRWAWGATNAARASLESMYFWGELVIHRKSGNRKFYDLAEHHIPAEILCATDPHVTQQEYYRWHVKRRVGSVGLLWEKAGDAWLGIHGGLKSAARAEAFAALYASGQLLKLEIEGVKFPFYIRSEDGQTLEESLQSEESANEMAFLAPLDNLIWDRKLIKELFGFNYTWEVYKRPHERQYGYYVLPVLYGNRFVARFEPRFNKKTRTLEILNWWWEEGITEDGEMKQAIDRALERFTGYLGAVASLEPGKMVCPEH